MTTGPEAKVAETIQAIRSPVHDSVAIRNHLDRLTKPPGSLGRFEDLAHDLARIYGDPPGLLEDAVVFVLAADHGVARQGVSAYPAEVTAQMCANFASGSAAINVLCRAAGARVVVVDMGVDADLTPLSGVLNRKVARGTADLSTGPAMSAGQAVEAVATGIELVLDSGDVPELVAIGEMGIGNTTSASAIVACLTGVNPEDVVGPGTGLDDVRIRHKREVVRRAVKRVRRPTDALTVLTEVGGFEIAGMAGVVLGAARRGRAVLVDGFISSAGALVATALCPTAREYLIASHLSSEPGHRVVLDALDLEPILDLGLRLGEGSGAALAIPIVRAAARLLREMATFESAGVSGPSGGAAEP